jgi:predicted nucleotidyltransferase
MTEDGNRVIETLRRHFREAGDGVVAAYLFGSHGRGRPRPDSDVDVGLLFCDEPPSGLAGPAATAEEELERRLARPVEVITLNTAPVDLVHRVLRDGVLVCERDPSARIRFEVAARRAYFDLLPALRLYRRGESSAA